MLHGHGFVVDKWEWRKHWAVGAPNIVVPVDRGQGHLVVMAGVAAGVTAATSCGRRSQNLKRGGM